MKEIGIDISSYEPVLKKSELTGLKWLAFKAVEVDDQYRAWNPKMSVDIFCTDPIFLSNWVQVAYDLNIPAVAYIFDNPGYKMDFYASAYNNHNLHPNDSDPQMMSLRQSLKNKTYHAICIDVERWWKYYNQYYTYMKTDPSKIEKIADTWIRDSAQDLYNRIIEDQAAGLLATVPIWFYTGKWFVDAYSPSLDTFLKDKIQWLADYTTPVYSQAVGSKSWADVKTIVDPVAFNPKWIGNKQAEILQLTDRIKLPGVYGDTNLPAAVDLDVIITADMTKIFAPGRWQQTTPPVSTPSSSPSPSTEIPPVVPPVNDPRIDEILTLVKENNELLEDIRSKFS
jgi:hypothetical protein